MRYMRYMRWESRGWRCCPPCSCSWYEYGSRDFAGRFGLDFSMAVVAVPFILYLVRFCSSKSYHINPKLFVRA